MILSHLHNDNYDFYYNYLNLFLTSKYVLIENFRSKYMRFTASGPSDQKHPFLPQISFIHLLEILSLRIELSGVSLNLSEELI